MISIRPLVFLDFDDVICINSPYGMNDLFAPDRPVDLWKRLFHKPAVHTLLQIIDEYNPHFVLTTTWMRLMDREGFEALLHLAGLLKVAASLHRAWAVPQRQVETRLEAIEAWLATHGRREPFVVLDGEQSGTGLSGSLLDDAGSLVLCKPNIGLTAAHLPRIRRALSP